jgi:hypothetical protein
VRAPPSGENPAGWWNTGTAPQASAPHKAVCAKAKAATSSYETKVVGRLSPMEPTCPDLASVAVCACRAQAFAVARYPIISYFRLVASLSHGAAGSGCHAAEILVFVARLRDMEKAASMSGLFS